MPVDVGLAKLSNDLIAGGIVAYSLGFLGFAVDAAFGNHAKARASSQSPAVSVPAQLKAPAMAGAPASAGVGGAGSVSTGAPSVVTDAAGVPGGAGDPAGGRPAASGLKAGLAKWVGLAAIGLCLVGWVLQAGAILTRGMSVHRLPWGNMYEFTVALTFAAVTAFLVILARQPVRYLGVFVMAPVALALGLAITVLYVPAAPLMPALHSYWLAIHVTAAIVAVGVFMVGTAATVMFLLAEKYAAASAAGKPIRFAALARMMPDAKTLDRTAYRTFAFAFPIWTFAVIAGAIWAEYAWGHYWQWDPKETWAFISWIVYAGYLHARATAGWRGRKAAYIALLGFGTLIFNFFIVNVFISGMHSYAGL